MYFPIWDLQSDSFGSIVRIAQVPLLPATTRPNWRRDTRDRHDPYPRNAEKGQAVDAVQETLGAALLLLGSLAAVLFAVILLLLEAKVILHLGGQLNRDLRVLALAPPGRPLATDHRPAPEPGPEERRDDAAR
jgi:hypothetical protein